VIGPTGKPFTEAGIGMALAQRDLSRHLRETGESKGYNASFTRADRSRFLQALEEAVQAIKRAPGHRQKDGWVWAGVPPKRVRAAARSRQRHLPTRVPSNAGASALVATRRRGRGAPPEQ